MDLRKLKTLIDLVSDSNVTELEITEAEGKVRIVKGPSGTAAPVFILPSNSLCGWPQASSPAVEKLQFRLRGTRTASIGLSRGCL